METVRDKDTIELMKRLDNREKKFVAAYDKTGDAANAARNAGYANSTALHKASMWVVPGSKYAKPHIIAALKKKTDKICDKYEVTTEKIVRGFAELAFAERVTPMDPEFVKDSDKIKALENLGKHKNIYADSEKNGNDVVHNILVEFKQDTTGTAKGVAVARSRSRK
jgi:phage terminase small subunit